MVIWQVKISPHKSRPKLLHASRTWQLTGHVSKSAFLRLGENFYLLFTVGNII